MTLYSQDEYTYSGGDKKFTITFSYTKKDRIKVFVNNEETTNFTFNTNIQIQINDELEVNDVITIKRSTPLNFKDVTFTDTSMLSKDTQNLAQDQLFYAIQEISDNNSLFKTDINTTVTDNKTEVETLIATNKTELETIIATNKTELEAAQDTFEASINANIATVNAAASKINELESAVNTATTAATTATTQATAAEVSATTATQKATELSGAVTDIEQAKIDILLKENITNKVSSFQETPDDIHYPTEKLLKDSLDNISGTPIGTVIPLNCTADYVPDGCLPCDGAEYTKEQFESLWDNYLFTEDTEEITDYANPHYTKVGSPTITDGVASGFSTANYLKAPFNPASNTWEIKTKITTGSDVTTNNSFIGNGGNYNYRFLVQVSTSKFKLCLGNNGTSWTIANNVLSTHTVLPNTTYFVKTIFTGTQYILSYSLTGEEGSYIDDITVTSSASILSGGNISIGANLSTGNNVTSPLLGSVDLNETYIKIDDEIAWQPYNKKYTGNLLNTCTYEAYATEIATYGQCGKFALDTVNEKFKVPTLKDGTVIQQAKSDTELAKAYNAGLPNITGYLQAMTLSQPAASGAFNLDYSYTDHRGDYADAPGRHYSFDASRSNSIYGKSSTVQPNAVALRYFIVVANGQINQSQMDWSAWASSLQGKVNKDGTNLTTTTGTGGVRAVVDAYINGASWYRVWSDGWIEQGGRFTGFNTAITITFLKPFSNTYYAIQQGEIGRAGADPYINGVFYTSLTKTSVVANMHNDGTNTYMWYACGY